MNNYLCIFFEKKFSSIKKNFSSIKKNFHLEKKFIKTYVMTLIFFYF